MPSRCGRHQLGDRVSTHVELALGVDDVQTLANELEIRADLAPTWFSVCMSIHATDAPQASSLTRWHRIPASQTGQALL